MGPLCEKRRFHGSVIVAAGEISYDAGMIGSKRAIFALVSLVLWGSLPFFAQTTISDPNDPVYLQLDAWATRGLLKNLPQLRPYAGAMLRGLLREVMATGSSDDARIAQGWLDTLDDQGLKVRGDVRVNATVGGSSLSYFAGAGPGFSLNTLSTGGLGMSGRVSALASKGSTKEVTPFGSGYPRDIGFEADSGLGGGFAVLQDFNSALTYGDESFGLQAGYMRGSWGPIFGDGVVVGPQAPASGQFNFAWRGKDLSADMGFYIIQQGFTDGVTRQSSPSGTDPTQNALAGLSGQKYLMLHGVDWSPTGWMTLGLFESMVWVNRIEPLYFLPLSELFTSQSLASWGDNSFAGVSGSLYLPKHLRLDGVAYADDLDFSGILKGHWDTKWKLALQAALSWAPPSSHLQRLTLDYTAIGPYTYTHWADVSNGTTSYVGALAYTNAGQNIGPALDPDSDRLTLKATSQPNEGVQAMGIFRIIRHGNASAGVNNYSAATSTSGNASGNLGDAGVEILPTVNAQNVHNTADIFGGGFVTGTSPEFLRFLTQSVIETSWQAGFGVDWNMKGGLGMIQTSVNYLFEYIVNGEVAGVGPVAGNNSMKHYVQFTWGTSF